jgi:hypothetical protein
LIPSTNNIEYSRYVDNNHNDNNKILNIANAIQFMIVNHSRTNMLNVFQKVDNDLMMEKQFHIKKLKIRERIQKFISRIILKMLIVLWKPLKY